MTTKSRAGAKPAEPDDDGDQVDADVQRTIEEGNERLAAAEEGRPDPHPERLAAAEEGRPDPHPEPPSEAELDARERELALRERELALAERERELAAREAASAGELAAAQGEPGLPEFLLTLGNGETVEAPNANASHHAAADGTLWPIVRALPIPGKYGVPYAQHPDNPDRRAS